MNVGDARKRFIKNVARGLNKEKARFEKATGLVIKDIELEMFLHYTNRELDMSVVSDVDFTTNLKD